MFNILAEGYKNELVIAHTLEGDGWTDFHSRHLLVTDKRTDSVLDRVG